MRIGKPTGNLQFQINRTYILRQVNKEPKAVFEKELTEYCAFAVGAKHLGKNYGE
jgi:hypothetical protein